MSHSVSRSHSHTAHTIIHTSPHHTLDAVTTHTLPTFTYPTYPFLPQMKDNLTRISLLKSYSDFKLFHQRLVESLAPQPNPNPNPLKEEEEEEEGIIIIPPLPSKQILHIALG